MKGGGGFCCELRLYLTSVFVVFCINAGAVCMLLSGDDACAPKLYSLRILNSPRGFGCSCPRTELRSFVFTPFLPFRSVAVAHQARFASAYPLLLATQSLPENTHTHTHIQKKNAARFTKISQVCSPVLYPQFNKTDTSHGALYPFRVSGRT